MGKILKRMNIWVFKKIKIKDITLLVILFALLCGFIKKTIYVLIIVILHEFGHVLMAILLKYKVVSIDIYPFGGITKIDKFLNDSFINDVLLSLGGVIIQSILILLGYLNIITDSFFLDLNYKIMIFNLLPIIPLDGAKVLFEVLNIMMSFYRSINYYVLLSFIGIIIFVYYNLNNLLDYYVIIGLFIQKTIDIYKNKHILFNKFLLERKLYKLPFTYLKYQNALPINYHKDVKYYYKINNKIIDDREYLNNVLK